MNAVSLFGRIRPRTFWLLYALLLAALAAVFFAPLSDHLLDTHDQDYFLDSADVLADASFFFSVDKRMPGRPFFEVLVLCEYALWGRDIRLFHWAGIALHALAAWLLAYTCWRLGTRLQVALMVGWLFLINSAPFQALQWISAHCYPLAMLCVCGGLLAYWSHSETGHYRSLFIAALWWMAGLLSHISAAVVIPFACYMAWKKKGDMGRVWRSAIALALGAVVVVMAIKIYYADAPQNSISADNIDLLAMAYNYLFLWGRLFVSSHWLPAEPWNQWGGELAVGAIGLCGLLWSLARRASPWDIALLWIALTLLPPLLLNPSYVRDIPAGPSRYLYLASAGVAFLEAVLITRICAHFLRWRLVWGKLVYTVVILGATAASAAALGRAEAIAFYNQGRNYLAEGQIELGVAQLQKSLAIKGAAIDREDVYVRLCPMVLNQGGDAHSCLQEGREAFPRNPTLHIYQQVVSALDDDMNAQRHLDSFRGKPVGRVVAEAYYHAGRGAFRAQDYARAVAALSRSLAFDGRRDDARLSLRAARATLSKQNGR